MLLESKLDVNQFTRQNVDLSKQIDEIYKDLDLK